MDMMSNLNLQGIWERDYIILSVWLANKGQMDSFYI